MPDKEIDDQLLNKLGINDSDKFALFVNENERKEFQEKVKQTKGKYGKDIASHIPDKHLPDEEKKKLKELERANKKELSWLSYVFHWIMRLGFIFGKPRVVQRHEVKKLLRNSAAHTGFYKNRAFTEIFAQKLDFIFYNCYQIMEQFQGINPFKKQSEEQYNALKKTKKEIDLKNDLNYQWKLFFLLNHGESKNIKNAFDNLSEDKISSIIGEMKVSAFKDYVKENLSKFLNSLQSKKVKLESDYNLIRNIFKIISYNLEPILKKFQTKYNVEMRKSSINFRKVHEDSVTQDIISYLRYLIQFDPQINTSIYFSLFKILMNFIKRDFNKELNDEEIKAFFLNIISNIRELLENKYSFRIGRKKGKTDALTICLKASTKNEYFYVDTKFPEETFIKEFFEKYKTDVRNMISRIQKEKIEEQKNRKIEELFGGNFKEVNPTYTFKNKELLDNSSKFQTTFNCVRDLNLILLYMEKKYKQYEQSLYDAINTNMLLDTYVKGTENENFTGIQKCLKEISEFIQMILEPFRRTSEDKTRDSLHNLLSLYDENPATFNKVGMLEDKVTKLDISARAVVEKFSEAFGKLKHVLDLVVEADKNAAIYKPDKSFQKNFEKLLKRLTAIKNNIGYVLSVLEYDTEQIQDT